MRVIIEKDYEKLSKWAADHVVETINRFQPTAERPFVLGFANRFFTSGHVCQPGKGGKRRQGFVQACHHLQYG